MPTKNSWFLSDFTIDVIYEPTFHENSHGFRPERSCHTALESLKRKWTGTKWVIQADITECFERICHHRLLDILRERIQDDRFINLIHKFLNAGYMENWVYHRTYSGTPQGSVVSPILTNIYLDKLDRALDSICQRHRKGERRKQNSAQVLLMMKRRRLLKQGEADPSIREKLKLEIRELNRRILQTPAYDYNDPSYIRVKFLRYADDVIIGIIGPKTVAKEIKEEIAAFLETDLRLELNRDKTVIIHLATQKAHFLGYEFKSAQGRYRRTNLLGKGSSHNVVQTTKTGSGNIVLLAPLQDLSGKLKKYMHNGEPASVRALVNQPVDHIIEHYNSVIRGWYNYYQLAVNVSDLYYARYILHYSLARTLAHKEHSSISKILQKYGKDIHFIKPNGRETHFFNQPMRQVKEVKRTPAIVDSQPRWWLRRTRTRLLENCIICDSQEKVEMHHVRHIRKQGQTVQGFTRYLSAINRKQVPVCRQCHLDIHKGKYDGASLASLLEQRQAPGLRG
jgi:group II intron reverse transcriptase/maturase